jgi:hypothetical protein
VQRQLTGTGIGMVAVGFSPPAALASMAEHLGLTGPMLSDEPRALYARLGVGRAPLWRVWSPGTVAFYLRRHREGATLTRPVEDTRQLGGDAMVVDGVIRRTWLPSSPDDRVAPSVLVAALVAAAR